MSWVIKQSLLLLFLYIEVIMMSIVPVFYKNGRKKSRWLNSKASGSNKKYAEVYFSNFFCWKKAENLMFATVDVLLSRHSWFKNRFVIVCSLVRRLANEGARSYKSYFDWITINSKYSIRKKHLSTSGFWRSIMYRLVNRFTERQFI
jgi:hypothetical protein